MYTPHLRAGILVAAPAAALAGLIACGDFTGLRPDAPARVGLAVALTADQERPSYDALDTQTADELGRPIFTLDEVCDIFIGEEVFAADDPEAPTRYEHQRVVRNLPAGAVVKLVGNAEMQASGSKTFVCDAVDRDAEGQPILDASGQVQPVIDPVTLHAAKGDGPKLATAGVTLDLNGYSITVSPSPFLDPSVSADFENLGIVVTGDDITVTNTSDLAAGGTVSRVYGFGHNIDVEAPVAPRVVGRRWPDATAPGGFVYNLETQGGMGVRLSGSALVEKVKSVDLSAEGQGFEIRRCAAGSRSVIRDSHFEGGLEGAFIRECRGVTFENNYVAGHGGEGIATREAVSTTERPIIIRGNTVASSAGPGIVWGRESRSNNNSLRIELNRVARSTGSCDIAVSRDDVTWGPYTLTTLAQANAWDGVLPRTCRLNDD